MDCEISKLRHVRLVDADPRTRSERVRRDRGPFADHQVSGLKRVRSKQWGVFPSHRVLQQPRDDGVHFALTFLHSQNRGHERVIILNRSKLLELWIYC